MIPVDAWDLTAAEAIVVDALMRSYPAWTDENGTNVEQLARIALRALDAHGWIATRRDQGLAAASPPG
jgi:hypothetical protein